ncbi:MAG: DUF2071 domain-containing protein [Bacteroidota bacterium]
MRVPAIQGIIDRRILVNFTVDPGIIQKILPAPFTPKVYEGKAIAGICLIRLKNIRPKGFTDLIGISSENGAHRIAVEWMDKGIKKEGVYIPRRDSSSFLNNLAGGRIFPGKHFHTKFNVHEQNDHYHISFKSSDNTSISIDADKANSFDNNSIFKTLENASAFFEKGEIGYSPNTNKLEGLKLKIYKWQVSPLKVTNVKSSFFENEVVFPKGSVKFDNALLMQYADHEWNYIGEIN